MKNYVLTSFGNYSDADLGDKAQAVLTALTENSFYPSPVPSLEVFSETLNSFRALVAVAKTGTRTNTFTKNDKREELEALMRRLASYINFTANNDRTMLVSTGFDLNSNSEPEPLTTPEVFKITNGENPGELQVKAGGIKGIVKSYLHLITTDETLPESQWESYIATTGKYLYTGLESGKRYFCRVKVIGTRGQSVYSNVVSRIAL
jgi:hypothetical protein